MNWKEKRHLQQHTYTEVVDQRILNHILDDLEKLLKRPRVYDHEGESFYSTVIITSADPLKFKINPLKGHEISSANLNIRRALMLDRNNRPLKTYMMILNRVIGNTDEVQKPNAQPQQDWVCTGILRLPPEGGGTFTHSYPNPYSHFWFTFIPNAKIWLKILDAACDVKIHLRQGSFTVE